MSKRWGPLLIWALAICLITGVVWFLDHTADQVVDTVREDTSITSEVRTLLTEVRATQRDQSEANKLLGCVLVTLFVDPDERPDVLPTGFCGMSRERINELLAVALGDSG